MLKTPLYLLLLYLLAIGVISIFVTVHDKSAAVRHRRRVPERTLLLLALFGGAVPMLLTMLSIRHKTRHLKFMAGLPLIILLHGIIAALLIQFYISFLAAPL